MFIEIDSYHVDPRKINRIVEILLDGGVIIYPTDTVYGFGCDIMSKHAIERICRIKGIDPGKAQLTFICNDISQISEYTKQLDNTVYRMLKRNLPGPYTFILEANNMVPKLVQGRKKTIGVRIPDHAVPNMIVDQLGRPMLSISVKSEDVIQPYFTSAYDIYEEYGGRVDAVIDGGISTIEASTIVDCTGTEPVILREGVEPLK
jgi:tRNA threonylcarbamoyl adenosine modification protein (Sua5/YciO/YrdC/YwlC family)